MAVKEKTFSVTAPQLKGLLPPLPIGAHLATILGLQSSKCEDAFGFFYSSNLKNSVECIFRYLLFSCILFHIFEDLCIMVYYAFTCHGCKVLCCALFRQLKLLDSIKTKINIVQKWVSVEKVDQGRCHFLSLPMF